jgi:glycosyltransferase involved in cell wall biosynthesis
LRKRILCIVPASNEEESIEAVVRDLQTHCPDADIAVIDDGSADATNARAAAAGATVVRLPMNLGIGAAVQTGLLLAMRRHYDYAVQVDGDGQHPASEIVVLLDALRSGGLDAVIGSRFLNGGYGGSSTRRLGGAILSRANSWILHRAVTDATSGFRAYNRRAISFLASTYADDYPEPEAILAMARGGLRVAEVPVTMRRRDKGRSSITPLRAIYYMAKVLLAMSVNASRETREAFPQESTDESTHPDDCDHRQHRGSDLRLRIDPSA